MPIKNTKNDKEDKNPLPIPLPVVPFSTKFDAFWPRFREVMAFCGGFGIMIFEALADKSDRPWLYAAAIGMMGLPIARYIEGTIGKFGSNEVGPTEPPPDPRDKSKGEAHESSRQ